MSIKDKYNNKPTTEPKSKGNREIVNKILNKDNTETQITVDTAPLESPKKNIKKATFELDATLHKRLRTAAVLHDKTMVEIVEKSIGEYLDRLEK